MNNTKIEAIAKEYLAGIQNSPKPRKVNIEGLTLELLAKRNHMRWCESKKKAGYVYGEQVDDIKKTSNLLVDWNELSEEGKQTSRENAKATLRILNDAGYYPVPIDVIIHTVAAQIHDDWVRTKLSQGYTYGPKRNDDESKGPKTHRDMLPFETLLELYPEDADYDFATAKGVVDEMVAMGYAFEKIA